MRSTDLDPSTIPAAIDARLSDGASIRSWRRTASAYHAREDIPAARCDRGRLHYGRAAESTLADWFIDRGLNSRVRLAWALLNVRTPSSRTVPRACATPAFARR